MTGAVAGDNKGWQMTHLDTSDIKATRLAAHRSAQMQRTQTMLMAAGLAALGIVAVAASMMAVF